MKLYETFCFVNLNGSGKYTILPGMATNFILCSFMLSNKSVVHNYIFQGTYLQFWFSIIFIFSSPSHLLFILFFYLQKLRLKMTKTSWNTSNNGSWEFGFFLLIIILQ
jgi:hypothetical protein